ncbi:hypothetical protein ANN_10328 [Periplaneta americana]|uniref:Peptidase M12B domain-containing protein n=1 Tax=Periplaneta americana TaxID=6978 RepID=A0ABQ8TPS7_PERAM|nr:hypothetical protein ANN_10328 [Periplaneta americana]
MDICYISYLKMPYKGENRGIIASPDDEYYVINPLPRRFRRRSADVPHVLVRWTPPAQRLDQALRPRAAKNPAARRRRSPALPPGAPVHVETAVFIDEDLFQHMALNFPQDTERELVRVVLAMINAVQLLYHDPSLGRQVNFVLKRLEILHVDPTSLQRPHDIDRFLSSFCTWQRSENPPRDSDPLHWDHALILTGLDLYVVNKNGKVSSQVVGLAPVAGMCTATSSCTVNEGRHFESVYVVAHELGHKTPQSQCLLDHSISGGQLDHNAEGTLPGERFNADQQCMLKYGRGSIHATQQPLDDVCRDLHCQRDRYTWTSHPALEGTSCGNTKWCRSGRCVARGLSALEAGYSPNQRVDGGWSEWTSFSDCASGCLYSEEGRLHAGSTGIMVSTRRCNNPRPENGGLPCRGSDRRFRTCFAEQCGNVQRTTIRDFADQICLRAREVDTELLGTGLQRISSDGEYRLNYNPHVCFTSRQLQQHNRQISSSATNSSPVHHSFQCILQFLQHHHRPALRRKLRHLVVQNPIILHDNARSHTAAAVKDLLRRWQWEILEHPPYSPDMSPCDYDFFTKEFVCDNYDMAPFSTLPEMCPVSSRLQVSRNKGRRREVPELRRLWSPASGCHFNCLAPGRGLRLVVAKDIKCRLEDNCEGGRVTSIQLCEPDKLGCGRLKTPFEHATTVCSKYRERVRRLSGFGMQISPVAQDPDRPCRVACQDDEVNHRFYLVNGEDGWFPFGTDCSRGVPEKKSYCVSGKCLEFGSDDTPVHESEYTLPLIGRLKRSLVYNSTTMVRTTLDQTTLDHIISKLNSTDNCNHQYGSYGNQFSIDLNNPVHVEVKTGTGQFNNEARGYEDIWRSPG